MTFTIRYVQEAIVGDQANAGVLLPLVQGALIDSVGAAISYITPAICVGISAACGSFDLLSETRVGVVS
jgi:hypothetical protein